MVADTRTHPLRMRSSTRAVSPAEALPR